MVDKKKFIELLENEYDFPTNFLFKFIVKNQQTSTVEHKLNNLEMIEIIDLKTRPSKNGNFISYSLVANVDSAHIVKSVYEELSTIEGILSL